MKRRKKNSLRRISDREFEAKTRAFHAIARMRHDALSLDAAAREEGTTAATIKKYLPAALRKTKGGKWTATKSDRYTRFVVLPDTRGPMVVRARGSSQAQLASNYLASVNRWTRNGKPYEIAWFDGKKVGGFELITDIRLLTALHDAGLLQLDLMYASLKDVA